MLARIGVGNLLALLLAVVAVYFARDAAHVCRYPYRYEAVAPCEEEPMHSRFRACAFEHHLAVRSSGYNSYVIVAEHWEPECILANTCFGMPTGSPIRVEN
jgi:hypothetical protein